MRNREIVLSELKSAVQQERECALRVLHLLQEVEADRHYLELGYPSLFEFATRELGYSFGAAMRRIQAMRLMKAMPEIEEKLQEGALSLCVASKTQSFFRQEDQKRKEEGQPRMSSAARREIVQSMLGASTRECEQKLAEISPESTLPRERTRPLGGGKVLIQFLADEELLAKLDKLKGLTAHQNFDGRYDRLIELLADLALKKLEPNQRPEQARAPENVQNANNSIQPSASSSQTPTPSSAPARPRTRYIPSSIKRAVHLRDRGQCSFIDRTSGRRCGSRHALQFDHFPIPFSRGGKSIPENLTLRCAAHNRYLAEKMGLWPYPRTEAPLLALSALETQSADAVNSLR
ncbi:MAG: hypothetical protein NDJ89_04710 [Oligoflexia bacterium]|nr:hypothetical protein [Oligoflexia bacterium]